MPWILSLILSIYDVNYKRSHLLSWGSYIVLGWLKTFFAPLSLKKLLYFCGQSAPKTEQKA